MGKVFLDTNTFIDAIHRRPEIKVLDQLENNSPFISPLSAHIYCYLYKVKTPNQTLSDQLKRFSIVDLTDAILEKALGGPTNDLEDNIQLHSCADADCDYFLTNDKNILKMKFFGKAKISTSLTRV